MGKTHEITRDYPVSAQTLWADILDPTALAESMKGAITYEGLPTEPVYEGQKIVVTLKRWGWLPMGQWTMEVVRRDDAHFILESREHGNVVRSYKHRLVVEPLSENSARYTDKLDVDAGLLTPFVFPMFKAMYEQRHDARRKRLEARA